MRCSTRASPRRSRKRCSAYPMECEPPPARLADHPQAELHRIDRSSASISMKLAAEDMQAHDDGIGRARAGPCVRRCRCGASARYRVVAGKYAQLPGKSASELQRGSLFRRTCSRSFRDGFVARTEAAKIVVGDGQDADKTADGPDGQSAPPRCDGAADRCRCDGQGRDAPHRRRPDRQSRLLLSSRAVLSEIPLDARAIMNEEPFGPVALINPVRGRRRR